MCLIVTYCDYSYEKIHQFSVVFLSPLSLAVAIVHVFLYQSFINPSVQFMIMTSLMLPSSELVQNLHRIKFC